MYKVLNQKIIAIAEKYADLIDCRIMEAALAKEQSNREIELGGELHEIADAIRILHQAIAMLERLSRISHGND